ncbi:hypothetical protein HD806DRAFT_445392 [Xylariaceae sp. AK1471]|nr:hypothetical protein HD806DRAFT_445392 [Xylariaceae sp. AK1471]
MLASPVSPKTTLARPVRLRSACTQCCAAKVKCSGERSGCSRCRTSGTACKYEESRVGKVPGIRAKRRRESVAATTPLPGEVTSSPDSIAIPATSTPIARSPAAQSDTLSWVGDWTFDPDSSSLNLQDMSNSTARVDLTDTSDMLTLESSNFSMTSPHDESCMLSPPGTSIDNLLHFELGPLTSIEPVSQTQQPHSGHTPLSLGLRPRSERDSRCFLECCEMMSQLENYIVDELRTPKLILSILKVVLERLAQLVEMEQDSRNLRCIMVFTTLMYQVLELLEVCFTIETTEANQKRSRMLSSGAFGFGLEDMAEELSAFRVQALVKTAIRTTDLVAKLRILADSGATDASATQGICRDDCFLGLEIRLKDLIARFGSGR